MPAKDIDIIIPAYHAQSTIMHTLCSIYNQIIKDKFKVTIINASDDGDDYKQFIDFWKDYIDIVEIANIGHRMRKGEAVNLGMQITSLPFVLLMDADDSYYSDFSTFILYKYINKDKRISVVSGNIIREENGELLDTYSSVTPNRIFKRDFIQDIPFINEAVAEDAIWIDELCANIDSQHKFLQIKDIITTYRVNDESITRLNDGKEYVEANLSELPSQLNYILNRVKDRNKQVEILKSKMYLLYITYIKLTERNFNIDISAIKEIFAILKGYPEITKETIIEYVENNAHIFRNEQQLIFRAKISFTEFLDTFMC